LIYTYNPFILLRASIDKILVMGGNMSIRGRLLAATVLVTSLVTTVSGYAATTELIYPPTATTLGIAFAQVSGNGRFTLFTELGTVSNIKVHDRQTGTTELVNTDAAGNFVNAFPSSAAKISADGRYVVFTTIGGVVNVKDRLTGELKCASVDSAGKSFTGTDSAGNKVVASSGAISADGSTVAFEKITIAAGSTSPNFELFVTNMATGTSSFVAKGGSPAVSADGKYLAFVSTAPLTAEPSNGAAIFVYDSVAKTFQRIDTNATSCATDIYGYFTACDISDYPTISNDGRFVSYQMYHETITVDGGGHVSVPQAFVADRITRSITRADFDYKSKLFPGSLFSGMYPSISGDGNYVLFCEATDRLNVDTSPIFDLFVFERATGNVARVDLATNGEASNADVSTGVNSTSISADGSTVVFTTVASNLVPGVAYDAIYARNTDGLGYPFSFGVTSANYAPKSKKLTVSATSTKGAFASGMELLNIGAMTWSSSSNVWTYSGTLNTQPATLFVGSIEGYKPFAVVTAAADTTAPIVSSSIPKANATKVLTSSFATINFSEAVVKSSKFSSISLKKGSTTIKTNVSIIDSKITIQPLSSLNKNTTYQVTIPAQAVEDAAGNKLGSAYSFSFTTGNQ